MEKILDKEKGFKHIINLWELESKGKMKLKEDYERRGLVISKNVGKCFICKKETFVYDIDFMCYVHPECQEVLMERYEKASRNGEVKE